MLTEEEYKKVEGLKNELKRLKTMLEDFNGKIIYNEIGITRYAPNHGSPSYHSSEKEDREFRRLLPDVKKEVQAIVLDAIGKKIEKLKKEISLYIGGNV